MKEINCCCLKKKGKVLPRCKKIDLISPDFDLFYLCARRCGKSCVPATKRRVPIHLGERIGKEHELHCSRSTQKNPSFFSSMIMPDCIFPVCLLSFEKLRGIWILPSLFFFLLLALCKTSLNVPALLGNISQQ